VEGSDPSARRFVGPLRNLIDEARPLPARVGAATAALADRAGTLAVRVEALPLTRWLPVAALAVLSTAAAWLIFRTVSGLTFVQDEWFYIVSRREWSVHTLLAPHNDQWATLPVLAYKLLFEWVGLRSYAPYAAVLVAVHLATAWVLFAFLRRRAPDAIALAGAVVLLFFFWAHEVLFWPIDIVMVIPAALGLLAWWAWDSAVPNVRRDLFGAVALTLGLASGGAAIPFALAATLVLLSRRPAPARLLWPAVVAAIYVVWYVAFGPHGRSASQLASVDLALLPAFIARGLSTLAAPILGLDFRYRPLALILLSVGAAAVFVWRRPQGPYFWIAIAGLVTFYSLVGVARLGGYGLRGAESPRYWYPTAVFVLIAAAELYAAAYAALRGHARLALTGALVAWLSFVLVADLRTFRAHRANWQARAAAIRAELSALQFLRPVASFGPAVIDRAHFFDLTAERYFAAIDVLGAPVEGSAAALRAAPAPARLTADRMVVRLFATRLDAVPSTRPAGSSREMPSLTASGARVVGSSRSCAALVVQAEDAKIEMRLPGGTPLHFASDGQRPTEIFYALFGDSFQQEASRSFFAVPRGWYAVTLPILPEGVEWRVRLDPPDRATRAEVCVA